MGSFVLSGEGVSYRPHPLRARASLSVLPLQVYRPLAFTVAMSLHSRKQENIRARPGGDTELGDGVPNCVLTAVGPRE